MMFNIGICQMKVSDSKLENLKRAEALMKEARKGGADFLVLPEMFNCPYDNRYFPVFAEEGDTGETVRFLAEMAVSLQCYVIGGSIPERDGDRIYNASFIFDRKGQLIGKHRKLHLFDIDVPGRITFKESAVFTPGNDFTVIDSEYGRFGVGICYDIRFPEYFRLLADAGIQMLFLPAAFNMVTGPAHWETLLRARAIDNQIFVIAVSPARNPAASYTAYGHSMAVSPWGDILWQADAEETVKVVGIDLGRIAEVRQNMPLYQHRRRDLYRIERVE
ncbi:MAG TPA: carbon-nitrogen hydrolase family protein [Bacillota bacterium]|nr:carbon-nitrogen hydrolase family protein [Bacillota bacterium]